MKKTGVGIVIGRFQVHELHEGHCCLIDEAFKRHGKVLIGIGVSPKLVTPTEPLDYPAREQMVKEAYPNAQVVPLNDIPHNNDAWTTQLDTLVHILYQREEPTIYHGRDSDIPKAYSGKFQVREIDEVPLTSGTTLREEIANTVGANHAWRAGAIYAALNQWPRVDPVVDVAVLRKSENGFEVLAGKRNHEQGRLRLPGGHFDVTQDETGEDAARREVQEETGLEVADMQYIGQYKVRSGAMLTTLYATFYLHGAAKGSDDLDEVFWLALEDVEKHQWADSHKMLITQVRARARMPY